MICPLPNSSLAPNSGVLPRPLRHAIYNSIGNLSMPIYGFHCSSCENEFETLVRSSDTVSCPACGSAELKQLLSRIAKPAAGAEDAGASSSGGHACSSPSCCMGGGCG